MKNSLSVQTRMTRVFSMAFAVIAANAYSQDNNIGEGNLEETIVTAQRTSQNIQDIGISIYALDGHAMRLKGADQASDLDNLTSNISIHNTTGGGVPVVIIRGVGLQNFRVNDTPTTAFYVDDVYQTSVASADFTMFDVERVEVLKGPQGGLYGRNAVGGAINIVSKRPEVNEAFNGYVMAGLGKYSETELEVAVGGGFSDSFAARVAGKIVKSDDTEYENVGDENFTHGEQDRWGLRSIFRFNPSNSLDIQLKLHAGEDNSDLPLLRVIGTYAPGETTTAIGTGNTTSTVSTPLLEFVGGGAGAALCDSISSGRGSDPFTCATITGATPASYGLLPDDGDRYKAATNLSARTGKNTPFLEHSWNGASLHIRFGERLSFESISAYDAIDYRRYVDMDATPLDHHEIDYNTDITSYSQEFRLSNNYETNLNWNVGIIIGSDEIEEMTTLYGTEGVVPLLFKLPPTISSVGATYAPQAYLQETESMAAYGRVDWAMNDRLNLIGELRFTKESKSFAGSVEPHINENPTRTTTHDDDDLSFVLAETNDEEDYSETSGKFTAEYDVADNAMVYYSLSKGYKSGGFFGGFATNNAQLAPFDEETILANELGFKSQWMDNRLRFNSSMFHYDRSNVQQTETTTADTVDIQRLTNIGDVEVVGAELNVDYMPMDGLMLGFMYGFTDAEVVDSDSIVNSALKGSPDGSLEGTNIPNYSKHTLNTYLSWTHGLGDSMDGRLDVEVVYRSERDLSVILNPEIEEPIFQEPAYTLVNLAYTVESHQDWLVSLYVDNAFDEVYRAGIHNSGLFSLSEYYGEPRTYGIRFQQTF